MWHRLLGRRLVGREASDLAVAAQGNGAEAVVGLPPAEAGDAGAEPERVRFHPHPEQAGEHQVASLVGCDEQPQAHDRQGDGKHGAAVYSMHPCAAGTTF